MLARIFFGPYATRDWDSLLWILHRRRFNVNLDHSIDFFYVI